MENNLRTNLDQTLIFGLDGAINLAKNIAKISGIRMADFKMIRFSDGEWYTSINESVRNKTCIIVQSTCAPVNENLMQLMVLVDALKRDSAKQISAIIPYFAYARQDRRNHVRAPITARLVADLLVASGIDKVTLIDIHTDQLEGFFNIPTDNISPTMVILDAYVSDLFVENKTFKFNSKDYVLVAPDYGAVKRVRLIADQLHLNLAIVDKKRTNPGEVEIQNLLGDVSDKNCIVIDDIVDTAGTIVGACRLIKTRGAKNVTVLATHPMLTGHAYENLKEAFESKWIDKMYFSNSIELKAEFKAFEQIKVVPLDEFLAKIIYESEIPSGSYANVLQTYLDDFNKKCC